MALIVVFENVSDLAEVSDYRVQVFVNHTKIAGPMLLKGHARELGWEALVKQWAKELKPTPYKATRKVRNEATSEGAPVRLGKQSR